ncbi:hypothetical protein [Litorimonas taeanensis]|uniref:hypothetical protein n=1 Tax=Litorimonas taeanensis TaxID=568099 RepID=UPI0011C45BC0|nr:hypothetical protein [Litorimonas taeanensis]
MQKETGNTTLITPPSLALHFAQERTYLRKALKPDLTPAQVVGEARRALDRTGLSFTRSVTDPQIQKSGLWLLEIIKSGAGVLDRATQADVQIVEIAPKTSLLDGLKVWRPGVFYISAAGLATLGLLQGTGLVVVSAGLLAGLHAVTTLKSNVLERIPFFKTQNRLPAPDGRNLSAEAFIRTDTAGFLNQISDALATADHILARMVQTEPESQWHENAALMALFQNLLEARSSDDGKYALEVIGKEMKSLLMGVGVEAIDYDKTSAHWFDELPALVINEGDPEIEMAAPALVTKEGRLLKRGTVWVRRP